MIRTSGVVNWIMIVVIETVITESVDYYIWNINNKEKRLDQDGRQ